MSHRPNTPLLDRVQLPEDLKRFSDAELSQVAEELRQEKEGKTRISTTRTLEPETAARIFDPFFTAKLTSGGSGLGMYIVYNIVTQTLGGKIECFSRQGDGTNIVIQIPMDNLD